MLLIVEKFAPVIMPQRHTTHESLRPVVRPGDALLILKQQWQENITRMQNIRDGVLVAHNQLQNSRNSC